LSIFSLPDLLHRVGAGRKLSDIEFLAIKEFGGKLKKNEGFLSATGTLATLTAAGGKDMYIARAKVTLYLNATRKSSVADKVELQINGTNVETAVWTVQGSSTSQDSGVNAIIYEFKNIGHKVLATQIIKLEVITLSAEVDVEGFIECFEETTGVSPQIPPL